MRTQPEGLTVGLTPVFLTNDQELLRLIRQCLEAGTGARVQLVQRRTHQEITATLLVVALMILLGTIASERALTRFADLQERQIRDLASLYLNELAVAVLPTPLRADVWEAFDALNRATRREGSLSAQVTTLDDGGRPRARLEQPAALPVGRAPTALFRSTPQQGPLARLWSRLRIRRIQVAPAAPAKVPSAT